MKITVVGSREYKDMDFAKWTIYRLFDKRNRLDTLVSGGARGIDQLAEQVVTDMGMVATIFRPDWERYGKRAGFLRNELIINEVDHVLAFWDGKSKGTKHSIDLAIKANKPLDIYVR